MNNTTKGYWDYKSGIVECYDVIAYTPGTESEIETVCQVVDNYSGGAEANARLIALSGNLNQKYDLDKLEALVDGLRSLVTDLYTSRGKFLRDNVGRKMGEDHYLPRTKDEQQVVLESHVAIKSIESALRAITRQPAGEKTEL